MQKDFISIARANRLIALAALAAKKDQVEMVQNVHQFPVSRITRPVPVFTSSRGKRMADRLAA